MVLGGALFGIVANFFGVRFEAARAQLASLRLQHEGNRTTRLHTRRERRRESFPRPSTAHVDDIVQTQDGRERDYASSTAAPGKDVDSPSSSPSSSSKSGTTPSGGKGNSIPWGDLPECCVEHILLGAGFQSALSATAACKGWRRVASSQNFWRKMFVVHFGKKETLAESARMRRWLSILACDNDNASSGEETHAVVADEWNWRKAFKEAVSTEWRWMAGRCMRTNDWVGHSDRVVHIALHNGRAITAALDGSVRIWDAKTGEEIAVFRHPPAEGLYNVAERERRENGEGEMSIDHDDVDFNRGGRQGGNNEDHNSVDDAVDTETIPVLCLAADDMGLAAAGMADGTVDVYDVLRGRKLHSTRVGIDPVVAVAVGSGWLVVGHSGGGIEVRAAQDGGKFLRLESQSKEYDSQYASYRASSCVLEAAEAPQHTDIVRCLEIHAASGLAAAASGQDVVVWTLGRPLQANEFKEDDDVSLDCPSFPATCSYAGGAADSWQPPVWLKGHTEPVRSLCFTSLPPTLCKNIYTVLVTGGDDATIRIWNIRSGQCLRELEGPPGTTEAEHAGQVPVGWTYRPPPGVTCVAVWANQLVEGRDDGSVLVWSGAFDDLDNDVENDVDAVEHDSPRKRGADSGVGSGVAALIRRRLSGEVGGEITQRQQERRGSMGPLSAEVSASTPGLSGRSLNVEIDNISGESSSDTMEVNRDVDENIRNSTADDLREEGIGAGITVMWPQSTGSSQESIPGHSMNTSRRRRACRPSAYRRWYVLQVYTFPSHFKNLHLLLA